MAEKTRTFYELVRDRIRELEDELDIAEEQLVETHNGRLSGSRYYGHRKRIKDIKQAIAHNKNIMAAMLGAH